MSSFIPNSAPFTDEQRAWLNGFFSGLMGIENNMSPGEAIEAAGITTDSIGAVAVEEEEEDFPWHDEALPIVDRMEMAEGKPLPRQLMAAMAQLDCGTCGYVCQTYAEAIASGEESNLTLCSPGGKETKQMIKKLVADGGGAGKNGSTEKPLGSETGSVNGTEPSGWSRKTPYRAKLIESRSLNGDGSSKDTRHVVIDLNGSGLGYHVGDALGVFPTNCRELASAIVERLSADPTLTVESMGTRKSLLDAIVEDHCLKEPSDELLELLAERTGSEKVKETLNQMLEDGVPDGIDVLDVMNMANSAPITATEVIETLAPLNPRLYSIASSMKRVGSTVHLTVGKVSYDRDGRRRKGVASTMLAERMRSGDEIRVFVQPSHGGFTVPADTKAPMIMVGPGTGIAPFIAFLQEREAEKSEGRNWLFFGDRNSDHDFLYEKELGDFLQNGTLDRLDTAFSRDGDQKVYVQDRMRQNASELWQWLQQGAYFFVCGDASRMAADVDRALVDVITQHGNMEKEEARAYLNQLKKEKRYVRDVY